MGRKQKRLVWESSGERRSTVFTRIEFLAKTMGLNVNELSKKLGYSSPEKLYRLGREEGAKPGFEIISDFATMFSHLNLRWFLFGDGEPFNNSDIVESPIKSPYTFAKSQREVDSMRKALDMTQEAWLNLLDKLENDPQDSSKKKEKKRK